MKILPLLKILPIVFAIITTIAFVSIYRSIDNERIIESNQAVFKQLGIDLMDASDYLTDQAQAYAVTGDMQYYDNYFEEISVTKRRENAVEQLVELGAPKDELELLSKARSLSVALEELEKISFEYVANGDLQAAQNIIFGHDYYIAKAPIIDTLVRFQSVMNNRCIQEAKAAKKQATISIYIAFGTMILIIIIVFIYFLLINSKIQIINYIVNTLTKITDGDFNVEIEDKKTKPGDEFGILSRSIKRLIDTIHSISLEINQLVADAATGNLTKRSDISKFDGEWEKLLSQLNNLLAVFFEKMINSAPMAYAIITDGVVQESNDYAKNHLGMDSGSMFEDYFERKQDADIIMNFINNNESVTRQEVIHKTKSGETFRYYINVNTLGLAKSKTAVIWGIDIEEDRAKSDAIKRAQEDLQKLIDVLPIAMLILDPVTSTVIYCNLTYLKMLGFDFQDEALGTDITTLYAENQPGGESSFELDIGFRKKILSSKEIVTSEFRFNSLLDEAIDTKIYGGEIIYKGQRCIIEIIHDISAEKKQTLMLQNAAEKEKEANKLKGRFLINMSHEILTPMNAIIGLSQVALLKKQSNENFDTFKKINRSSKNLLTMINDILDFSKIEDDKLELTEKEFYIEDVISNVLLIASERIGDKQIEILLDISNDCPYFLIGDKTRLWQILKSLLDNAAKYTDRGKVVLSISVDRWETDINGVKSKVYLNIEVKDTGIGMTKAQIDNIFMPFNKTDKEVTGGIGLGMTITERLINLMEGSLSVESELGAGTCVTVKIGFKLKGNVTTKKDIFAKLSLNDIPILVISDDESVGDIMKDLLTLAGADVVCVSGGSDGVEQIKMFANGHMFKMIIIDYLINNEIGFDISKHIKPYIKNNTKLIIVSANPKQFTGGEINGFDVIEKPFVPSFFVQRIYDLLNTHMQADNSCAVYEKFTNAKVLLCEDNVINQDVAVGMFDMFGICPTIAENGKEALELLEKQHFDIVFMDIMMPVMDGHTATVCIRNSDKHYRDIPIIAMTANVMKDEVDLCLSEGMNSHIGKPIDIDALYNTLVKHLTDEPYCGDSDYKPEPEKLVLDGVDIANGIRRYGGKQDKYLMLLYKFAQRLNPESYRLEALHSSEEALNQIRILIGTSGNLFVTNINDRAKILGQSFASGYIDTQICDSLADSVAEMKSRILDFVPQHLDIGSAQPQNP